MNQPADLAAKIWDFDMRQFELEKLTLESMFSGHLCLLLSEKIEWKNFPKFADEFCNHIGGNIVERTVGAEMQIWKIKTQQCLLKLVFDDYPLRVSLESSTDDADSFLRQIFKTLKAEYADQK